MLCCREDLRCTHEETRAFPRKTGEYPAKTAPKKMLPYAVLFSNSCNMSDGAQGNEEDKRKRPDRPGLKKGKGK